MKAKGHWWLFWLLALIVISSCLLLVNRQGVLRRGRVCTKHELALEKASPPVREGAAGGRVYTKDSAEKPRFSKVMIGRDR